MTQYITDRDQSRALTLGAKALQTQLQAIDAKEIVLALPGGRSTAPFLAALTKLVTAADRALWSRVQIFIVDERLVPLDHPDSNFALVRTSCATLFKEKLLTDAQLHPFVSEGVDEREAISLYSDELQRFGGRFHVTVISSGEDGHIAGLFPHHRGLKAEGLFTTFHDSPKPPPHRMTATRKLIERSDAAVLFFLGEGKREALKNFKDPSVSLEACPAKIVNGIAKTILITDLG